MAKIVTSPTFLCGELKPGRRNIGTKPPKPPGPPRIIPKPPIRIFEPPGLPPVPPINDPWVCICDEPCYDDPNACDNPGSRRCIKKSTLPPGALSTREFATKADCELTGFGEAPCWVCSFKCVEMGKEYCPPYRPYPSAPPIKPIKRIIRDCQRCANAKTPPPGCGFKSLPECERNCQDEYFKCPKSPPPTTSIPGDVVTPGPVTPRSWYGCIEVRREYCPDNPLILKRIVKDCRYSTIRGGPYRYTDPVDCERDCQDEEFPCPSDPVGFPGPITGGEDPDPTDPGRLFDSGSGGVTDPRLIGISIPEDQREELNVDNLNSGRNSGQVTKNESNDYLYDQNYNIFQHPLQDFDAIEYVSNSKYLNIFRDRIPKAISYVLDKSSVSSTDWDEFYYNQVVPEILILALRPDVLDMFRKVNDETNQRVSLRDLLYGLSRHILLGKMDRFDITVFEKAKVKENEKTTVITRSKDQSSNQRAALGLISDQAYPFNLSQYPDDQRPYISRLKALLTDINAKVTVYSSDGECSEDFDLTDAGIPVDGECYVGEGNGDNYYIGTCDNEGLNVTTDKDKLYFLPYTTKKLALDILGQGYNMSISASSIGGSEAEANYDLSSGIGPMYFALKPETLRVDRSGDEFVTYSTGRYELLTSGEAQVHSDTYGLMATVANVDYDDPMLMYASNSSSIEFRGPDITFKAFDEGVGFGYDILPRQIPRAIVLQPVSSCQDNPFYGMSEVSEFGDIYTRTIRMQPHFNPEVSWPFTPILSNEDYPAFQVGFSGVLDTQNIIFQYDPSSFNSFEGTRETPIVKKIVKDLITDDFDANYLLDFLTWHDVWSRLTGKELAQLFHNESSRMRQEMMNGGFGPNFIHVLNRPGAAKTGLNTPK
jgi:hypothetical protein